MNHPIDKILAQMSERDLEIAEIMVENGFSDEDLYASLPTQAAVELLSKEQK